MRRYYVVSVILLMLPSIDLTVAAPVLVQEKRQAGGRCGTHTRDNYVGKARL
jgi:hypothetical protein